VRKLPGVAAQDVPRSRDWVPASQARFAGRHGVTPLISAEGRANVGRRNLWLSSELLAVLELFERSGVPAVPLKGPVLAVQAYGSVALREFRDLDILVHRRDIDRARELLLARGYHLESDSPSGWHQRLRRDNGLIVELHWEFSSPELPYPVRAHEVWSRLEPVRLGARVVQTLSGEDLALLLCAHGAKHLWKRLEWIGDIAALLARRPDIDWRSVLTRARARGAERIVLLALYLANELLGAPIPTAAGERVRTDTGVPYLGRRVYARLLRSPRPLTTWETRVFYWHVRERWLDRVRQFTQALFTPRMVDLEMIRLPDALAPLYYLIRPLRLTAKYTVRLALALV
jgi:hypothetical protein